LLNVIPELGHRKNVRDGVANPVPLGDDECDFERHVDYIHYNPVKHGHVKRPVDWPFSTLHRYVKTGVLPAHLANDLALEDITCGER